MTAFALAGRFSRPIQESIVPRVAIALPETGGQVSQRTEGFRMLETLSFASAQGTATGIESEDATFRTSVTVVVEGLNILGLITADRVVARLVASCTVGSRELSVASTGSTFDNLRIAGYPVRVGFASRVVPNSDSHLNAVKVLAPRRQDPLDSSPRPSLVKNIDTAADLRFSGKVISIPQFGTIYLGELEVLPQFERLTMLRVELDSSIIGSVVVASCECGGVRLVQ